MQFDRLVQRLAVVQAEGGPEPTVHTDGAGRVEARQWKHDSKGHVSSQREVWKQVLSVLHV